MTAAERFDHYMDRCLYGPEGFYASGRGVAGRRGDFITSPEVGPLFGAVVARWLDGVWDELGQPATFPVIDAGTGPGTLLRSLVLAEPRCSAAWTLRGVDIAAGDTRTGDGFSIDPVMPDDLEGAVVLANELLDNLPFRWIERTARGFVEVGVADGARVEMPLDGVPDGERDAVFDELVDGESAPLLERAGEWVSTVVDSGAARVLVFDYGATTTSALARRGGWLRTYQGHGRGDDPFEAPGRLDITTDIAVDQLPTPSAVSSQADFLTKHGIDDMIEAGRAHWAEHAAKPNLDAFRMRSRINEGAALLDTEGLGSWLALQWTSDR